MMVGWALGACCLDCLIGFDCFNLVFWWDFWFGIGFVVAVI